MFILHVAYTVSQTTKEYTFDFSISDYVINQENGVYTINSSVDSMYYYDDINMPAVPCKTINILIPRGFIFSSYDIDYDSNVLLTNCKLYNNRSYYPTNVEINEEDSLLVIATESIENPIINISTNTFRGYNIVSFTITPFLYNQNSEELSFIDNIKIAIKNRTYTIQNKIDIDSETQDVVRDIIYNKHEIESYGQQPLQANNSNIQFDFDCKVYPAEYVIITCDSLKESFEPLAKWKRQKGIYTEVVTIDSIYANYQGDTEQLKIKNFLKDKYTDGLNYVLLGGDINIVPVQKCVAKVTTYDKYKKEKTYYELVPCDLYYACFDRCFDWDLNKNGKYGEDVDSVDLVPEIYYSRIPAKTKKEVSTIVTKILNYEKYPPTTNDYAQRVLYCGSPLDEKTSTHDIHEDMYNNYINKIWDHSFYYLDDTGSKLVSNNNSSTISSTALRDEINKNYHIIHEISHGSYNSWQIVKGSDYYTTKLASQRLNIYPSIILTTACHTNAFHNASTCLSEAFLFNPQGGALAYLGSSSYGWHHIGAKTITNHISANYNATILQEILNSTSNNYNWGKGVALGKAKLTSNCGRYNAGRWLQMSLNPLGDPEMPILTAKTKTFDNVSIERDSLGTVDINTGGIFCTITVYSDILNSKKVQIFKNKSHVILNNVIGGYSIVLSKHNYTPYISPHHVSTIKKQQTNFTISSNSAFIVIEANSNSIATKQWQIKIINSSTGLIVKTASGNIGEEIKISTSDINSGLYTVYLQYGTEIYTKQITINK